MSGNVQEFLRDELFGLIQANLTRLGLFGKEAPVIQTVYFDGVEGDSDLGVYGLNTGELISADSELEVENVKPTSHVIPIQNVFRKDKVSPPLSQSDALANAPDAADGGFRVPRVVEES